MRLRTFATTMKFRIAIRYVQRQKLLDLYAAFDLLGEGKPIVTHKSTTVANNNVPRRRNTGYLHEHTVRTFGP